MVRSAPGARERAELAEVTRRLQQRDAELARANASLASMQARVRALEAEVKDLKATAGEDDEDGCSFSEISEQSASTLLSRYSKRIFRYLCRFDSNDVCELVARALRMIKWEGETNWEGETAMHGPAEEQVRRGSRRRRARTSAHHGEEEEEEGWPLRRG